MITMKFHEKVLTIQKLFYFAEYPANMFMTATFSLRVYRSANFYRRLWFQLQRQQVHLFENAGETEELYTRFGSHVLLWLLVVLIFNGICAIVDSAWLHFYWPLAVPSFGAHVLPSIMISLCLLQYVMMQQFLSLLYMQLNKRVAQLQLPPNGLRIRTISCSEVEFKLEQLRLVYVALEEVQTMLLYRFGMVLLLNFANSLLSFSYEMFNMFRLLELAKWKDWVLYSYRSLWLLLHGSRVWFVLKVNERIAEQKHQLCLFLNKLDASDAHLERVVNHFLVQLQANMSQPLAVCGVVDLDTLAVGGFINALMAIVIFLIQMDLGNKSLMGFV
ncbi:GH20441 [Drosophila grimshawi]|uniref:Gustatory receptor n=2 Tax=Drosophila grimshawi TaxID=7222 RepID=B4J9P2_DROGR|nr:GH20441 [Drosophila grimshawi]